MIKLKLRRAGRRAWTAGVALVALAAAAGGFSAAAEALTRFSYTHQYPYYGHGAVSYAVGDGLFNT